MHVPLAAQSVTDGRLAGLRSPFPISQLISQICALPLPQSRLSHDTHDELAGPTGPSGADAAHSMTERPATEPACPGSVRANLPLLFTLDYQTREYIQLIVDDILNWPRMYGNTQQGQPANLIEIQNFFISVLKAVDRAVSRRERDNRAVFRELFDLVRGVAKSDPSPRALIWISQSVLSPDYDIACLGAALVHFVPTELTLTRKPKILWNIVHSHHRYPHVFDHVLGHHLAALSVRQATCPELLGVLRTLLRQPQFNLTHINQLTCVMRPEDVEQVMYERYVLLDLSEAIWVGCFTTFALNCLLSKRLPAVQYFLDILSELPGGQLRIQHFLIMATFNGDPSLVTDFLITGHIPNIPNEAHSGIVDETFARGLITRRSEQDDEIFALPCSIDIFLYALGNDTALQQFKLGVLPQCLRLFHHGTLLSSPMLSLASEWFKYLIWNADLDASTFWSKESIEHSSYYRNVNYLGVLVILCNSLSGSNSAYAALHSIAWCALADSELYIPCMRNNFKTLSYLLITSMLQFRDRDLEESIQVSAHSNGMISKLHDISIKYIIDNVGTSVSPVHIINILRCIYQPTEDHFATLLNFGPVFETLPTRYGIYDTRPLAALALMHDPILIQDEFVCGLIKHLDTVEPIPVRMMTWMATDPDLYQQLLGFMTDYQVAFMESGNFYFSLIDCIVKEAPRTRHDQIEEILNDTDGDSSYDENNEASCDRKSDITEYESPDENNKNVSEMGDDDIFCTECLEHVSDDVKLVRLSCNHHFCFSCICPWMASRGNCPICRAKHTHRLTPTRFRELCATFHTLLDTEKLVPDDWPFWVQSTDKLRRRSRRTTVN